ncbi:MAG: dihydrodipicolinate synthase family protein [Rhodobacter sp.]|nr:dihydrodipicolinate synthase family protein [Thiotrichales bacterium]MCY4240779.1 dihydrodipicolinate synthase family protein [Rhodobacter sp.]
MDLAKSLTGISGILVTPFDGKGDIAPERQKPIVDRAITAGVQILTANGNTGEFYSLTTDEAVEVVEAAAGHVAGRVPLVAGVGRSIRDACRPGGS